MNAVAFITDFICKDGISSLDGFYASVIITATPQTYFWFIYCGTIPELWYWQLLRAAGLTPDPGMPSFHIQLPPGLLRTSLRVHHSVDVAKKHAFCYARCCTSTEQKGSLCLKGFITRAQHRCVWCIFYPACSHLLPEAMVPVPSKLGMVFKRMFGHSSWKTCLKMRLSRKIRCSVSLLFPTCPQSAASLWDSDTEGSYGFHKISKDYLCHFSMLTITLSHRGWSKY